MEAFIESDEQYAYLTGINRFRNYLVSIHYDLSTREWLGRGLSKAGYINVRPDNLNSVTKRHLLRYLITLDVLEEERAEDHATKLFNGEIPDTSVNRRLANPQFQFITPDLLVGIDLMWSMHRNFVHAFPAVREWYEIRQQGRRYHIPELETATRCSIPPVRWFKVSSLDHPWGIDGLRDYYGEAVNPKRKPHSVPYMQVKDTKTGEPRRVVPFEESDELEINAVDASLFVNLEYEDLYFETLNLDSIESAKFYFDRGIAKTSAGHMAKLDHIARRGQFWDRLQEALNVMDIQVYVIEHSISDAEHKALLAELPGDAESQLDLFGFEAIPEPPVDKPLVEVAA